MLRPHTPSHVIRQNRINAERRFAHSDADLDSLLQRVYAKPNAAKEVFSAMAIEGSPDYLASSVAGFAEVYGEPTAGFENHLADLRDGLREWFAAAQDLVSASQAMQAADHDQNGKLRPTSASSVEDVHEQ